MPNIPAQEEEVISNGHTVLGIDLEPQMTGLVWRRWRAENHPLCTQKSQPLL